MTTSTSSRTTTRAIARISSALAVGGLVAALALVACGTEVAGDGLAALRIGPASGNGVPAAGADSSGAKLASGWTLQGALASGWTLQGALASGWTLQGALPAGPSSGPVLRFIGAPGEDDVRAVAATLGLTAAPDRHAHGWVVDGTAGELRVRNDTTGQWSFSRSPDCPSYFVDVDRTDGNSGASCAVEAAPGAVAAAPTTVAPSPPASDLPLVTAVLATARPVFAAAGIDATPRVLASATGQSGAVASVVVDPTVADLPTAGLRSVVDVDAQGVVGASGWLGGLSADGDYPVVSAQEAFDRLDAMPRALAAIACPSITPGPLESDAPDVMPCAKSEPVAITGATFGLTLSWEGLRPILVPAWLFTATGWDDPVAQIAVADQYLAETPVAPPTDPDVAPEPALGYVSIENAIVSADGTSLTLIGWGGVCAEYSGEVKEASDHVYGYITSRWTIPRDEACIEMAKEVRVTVRLQEPLGTRTLIDQTSNSERVVPVAKT